MGNISEIDRIKERIRKQTAKNPEKFFPVQLLKQKGLLRQKCKKSGKYFWALDQSDVCGEPELENGFSFVKHPLSKKRWTYTQAWNHFAKFMKKRGYTPINRYPVAARWREDTDFVQASIYDFQPHVVSGAVEPPANPLVIPQFCVRFNDLDNVGVTGAHYSGFTMVGQHAFFPENKFHRSQYLSDMIDWIVNDMEIPLNQLKIHEDAWAGGGNAGACMEFFAGGLELLNQVYMLFSINGETLTPLSQKVLDMGMGLERVAWATHQNTSSYPVVMPAVVKLLNSDPPPKELADFLQWGGYLNLEGRNAKKQWTAVGKRMGVDGMNLRKTLKPVMEKYAIADHTRTLLITLADGVLPSNTGGGYNLRLLIRRSLAMIRRNGLDVSLLDCMTTHAKELKGIFPELKEHVENIASILEAEEKKEKQAEKRTKDLISRMKTAPNRDKLVQLYQSEGILPERIISAFPEGKIDVPDDFYAQLSQEGTGKKAEKTEKIDAPETQILYWKRPTIWDFSSKVVYLNGNELALEKTAFYPTSGGQLHDTGTLSSGNITARVLQTRKVGNVIVHVLEQNPFTIGMKVNGKIDKDRRKQLMQHHTATHILNGVSKNVLGPHIWQAGSEKTPEKARLDITHYRAITKDEIALIQAKANAIVRKNLPVHTKEMKRELAEKKYGFTLYQGGAVPGKRLRIVEIPGLDVEACGGTHCQTTGEVGPITIIKVKKIQDGIMRLEYVAGQAKQSREHSAKQIDASLKKYFPDATAEDVSIIFSVPIENAVETAKRFTNEVIIQEREIAAISKAIKRTHSMNEPEKNPSRLFKQWKDQRKTISSLEDIFLEASLKTNVDEIQYPGSNRKFMFILAKKTGKIISHENEKITFCPDEKKRKSLKKIWEKELTVKQQGPFLLGTPR